MIPQNITIAELFSQSGINIPLQYTTKDGLELTHFIAIAIDLERYKEISNNRIGEGFITGGLKHPCQNKMSFNIYLSTSPD